MKTRLLSVLLLAALTVCLLSCTLLPGPSDTSATPSVTTAAVSGDQPAATTNSGVTPPPVSDPVATLPPVTSITPPAVTGDEWSETLN